ncbi:MAG: hypothetical protein ACO1O1_02690 [Adhaeribacter sp.]
MEKTTLLEEALLRSQPEKIVNQVIEMLQVLKQQDKEEQLQRTRQARETEAALLAAWENAWLY